MQRWKCLHDDMIMEIAVLIEDVKQYKGDRVGDYKISWGSSNNGLDKASVLLDDYKTRLIDYLYFGNEFCEYKIPSVEQLMTVLELCKNKNLKCVLVTPVVTDFGIGQISLLLDYLIENKIFLDIVVNDVGVLILIQDKKYQCNPILGRIFDKTSRDSRATNEELEEYYGKNGKKFAMSPGVISSNSQMVYKRFGVDRFEFDMPRIGLDLPGDCNFSLYWPYSYLTTGRVCLLRSIELDGKDKFLVGNSLCKKACMRYKIEKRKPKNGYSSSTKSKESDLFLFQKGNTLFFVNNDVCSIEKFNRLIIQL